MNIRCWLLGHEHRFKAAIVRRVERAGVVQFRCDHVESCYRCSDEQQTELPQACTSEEVAKLFEIHQKSTNAYAVTLDGRPMGTLENVNEKLSGFGWRSRDNDTKLISDFVTKDAALAALW